MLALLDTYKTMLVFPESSSIDTPDCDEKILFLSFASVRKSVGQPGGVEIMPLKRGKIEEKTNTTKRDILIGSGMNPFFNLV